MYKPKYGISPTNSQVIDVYVTLLCHVRDYQSCLLLEFQNSSSYSFFLLLKLFSLHYFILFDDQVTACNLT